MCVSGRTAENIRPIGSEITKFQLFSVVSSGRYFYSENLESLVKFMPRRLLEVIEKASNTTKY